MNLKSLVVITTSLLSLNASAVLCEAELQKNNGQTIKEFLVNGPSLTYSCSKAMRDCEIEKRMLLRQGRNRKAVCVTVTVNHRPGNGGVVTRPSRPSTRPTRPSIPSRPQPRVGTGNSSYALDRIEDILRTGGWKARQYAVEELSQYRSVRALKMALKAIGDSDADVQRSAKQTLNQIVNLMDTQRYAHQLINQLPQIMQSSGWKVRQVGAQVLGKVGTAEAIIPLLKSLSDSDSDVKTAAKNSVNNLKNSYDFVQVMNANIDSLNQYLKTSGWVTRQEVAKIMGEASMVSAVDIVLKATGDSDKDVSNSAVKSLNMLMSSYEIQYVPRHVINTMIKIYKTSGWRVRVNAVKVLAATKKEIVLNTLYDALGDSDSDVRRAAQIALDNFRY
jgi:hypothetical protein